MYYTRFSRKCQILRCIAKNLKKIVENGPWHRRRTLANYKIFQKKFRFSRNKKIIEDCARRGIPPGPPETELPYFSMTYAFCSVLFMFCSPFVPLLFSFCSVFVPCCKNKTWTNREQKGNKTRTFSFRTRNKPWIERFLRVQCQKGNNVSTYCSATYVTYIKKVSKKGQNRFVESKMCQKTVNRSQIVTLVYHIPEQNRNKTRTSYLNATRYQLLRRTTNKTAMQHGLVHRTMKWKPQKSAIPKCERFAK